MLRDRPGWEIVTPAQLGIVCFRRVGGDDADGVGRDGRRRLRGALHDGPARRDGVAALHDQPAHDFEEIEETIARIAALAGAEASP